MFDFVAKLWEFLRGKKTVIGSALTVLAATATYFSIVLPVFGVDAVQVGAVVGFITQIVGLLDKLYRQVVPQ